MIRKSPAFTFSLITQNRVLYFMTDYLSISERLLTALFLFFSSCKICNFSFDDYSLYFIGISEFSDVQASGVQYLLSVSETSP